MANLGVSFYINLLSVIATTYILTWYIFTPSPNQCQMTFMMEPPKFIPIEVDRDTDNKEYLTQTTTTKTGGTVEQETESKYKLYMYSEFGFPMASDVRRDLRDSMPVLFVPGNAGSYQQVRSLASTCIRRQLQSLDAFKFIFYTIDFGGQFSGMSGDLIDRQTLFVQRALRQITKMHPSDTEGTILIGHSVGGFISKYLFTKPNFQPSSVPLMISLASPLTRPYLVLDDKMGKIYRMTEEYWNKLKTEQDRDTIAVSISGGATDRLVPMQLSLDPTFDLSLTTESMRDLFMSTDHVSITWCRELMHKLANLMSALMDKKHTRLISDRSLKLSIIEKELLLKRVADTSGTAIISKGDWTSRKANEILDLVDTHQLHRNQLKDNLFIFKRNSDNDLLIIIDHIDPLKASTVFGCSGLSFNDTSRQIMCQGRSDLTAIANSIPTNRYEPRRSIIRLTKSATSESSINQIGFDFTGHSHKAAGPPEMIAIQKMSNYAISGFRIPSLFESLIRKILFLPIKLQLFPRLNTTTELFEIELSGPRSTDPALSLTLVTSKCLSKGKPASATLIYYRKGYMGTSAYLSPTEVKNQQTFKSVMNLRDPFIIEKLSDDEDKSYLNIYLDGTCENVLEVELNLLNLAANMLQTDLGTMLSCLFFLVNCSILSSATRLTGDYKDSTLSNSTRSGIRLIGSTLVVVISRHVAGEKLNWSRINAIWTDYITSIVLTLVFTEGLLSFSVYFIRRLIDLATIVNNTQVIMRNKVASSKQLPDSSPNGDKSKNGYHPAEKNDNTKTRPEIDLDWPMIGLAIATGPFLSGIPIAVLSIFLLIKKSLHVSSVSDSNCNEEHNKHCCDHEQIDQRAAMGRDTKNDLLVNLIVICSLVLFVNIPDLLLKLTNGMGSTNSSGLSTEYVTISLMLILVKWICNQIENGSDEARLRWLRASFLRRSLLSLITNQYTLTLMLMPIIDIVSNVRLVTNVAVFTFTWLINYLNYKLVKSTI